jgi:hypothetical protein
LFLKAIELAADDPDIVEHAQVQLRLYQADMTLPCE